MFSGQPSCDEIGAAADAIDLRTFHVRNGQRLSGGGGVVGDGDDVVVSARSRKTHRVIRGRSIGHVRGQRASAGLTSEVDVQRMGRGAGRDGEGIVGSDGVIRPDVTVIRGIGRRWRAVGPGEIA